METGVNPLSKRIERLESATVPHRLLVTVMSSEHEDFEAAWCREYGAREIPEGDRLRIVLRGVQPQRKEQ
jgi:hypothetical protein